MPLALKTLFQYINKSNVSKTIFNQPKKYIYKQMHKKNTQKQKPKIKKKKQKAKTQTTKKKKTIKKKNNL